MGDRRGESVTAALIFMKALMALLISRMVENKMRGIWEVRRLESILVDRRMTVGELQCTEIQLERKEHGESHEGCLQKNKEEM